MKKRLLFVPIIAAGLIGLSGCNTTTSHELVGTGLGAAAGAGIGHAITGTGGGAIGGAVVGGILGNRIGASYDRRYHYHRHDRGYRYY